VTNISISELAKSAGVTTRTLRHYQDIGLLNPAGQSASGVREYDQSGIVRLQSILVLRELGLGLPEIAAILANDKPLDEALRGQAELLGAQVKRLTKMRGAVLATLTRVENGEPIMAQESFEGFDNNPYADEARERWPNQYADSQQRYGRLTREQQQEIQERHQDIAAKLADLFKAQVAADAPEVQEQIDRHYGWICEFWTPSAEAYRGLGQMYVDDERFASNYNDLAEGLAPFIRGAILHYASSNLD
jgi:DNA-binding transcriptional MerR regulator